MLNSIIDSSLLYIVVAIVALFGVINGLRTGRASNFVPGGFERSERPVLFWIAIGVSALAFIASIYVLIDML